MKYKKITALLLAGTILFVTTAMTGCDNNNSENNSGETAASQISERSSTGYTGDQISQKDVLRIAQLYGAAGCIYLCGKNNIAIDEDYKKNIIKEAGDYINELDIQIIGTSDLAKVICTDRMLDLGMGDKLNQELYVRYNEQAKLFDEYAHDDYKDIDDDTKTAMQMAATDAVWTQLNSFGFKDEKYDVKKLLIDAFNSNVEKYDHNDIYKNTWTITDELENIFYYFLNTDSLDSLNYQKIWDVLGSNYLRNIFETNENNEEFKESSINNISGVLTDSKAKSVLNAGITPKYTAQEYFNTLSDENAFLYNKNSDNYFYYEYILFLDLSQPSDLKLSENSFFTKNVNKWLKQCYNNNHIKPESSE